MHQWLDNMDWMWMSAVMIVWILLIAVVGYAAVLAAWRQGTSLRLATGEPSAPDRARCGPARIETADRPRLTAGVDPTALPNIFLRDLRTGPRGLSTREAARRLVAYGPNELRRRAERRWPRELVKQFVHPLALLLWLAAALALIAGTPVLAGAIVAVIVLNAAFAFVQEQQAEKAVEALKSYLPLQAFVVRDGRRAVIEAKELVPGDVLLLEEGERISADARLLDGARRGGHVHADRRVGARLPSGVAERTRGEPLLDARRPRLQRHLLHRRRSSRGRLRDRHANGARPDRGACRERVDREESPLERQVRRVAWLIAGVAIAVGAGLPAARHARRRACVQRRAASSRSACWSPTCPRGCCRRSPSRSRSASRRSRAAARWSSV